MDQTQMQLEINTLKERINNLNETLAKSIAKSILEEEKAKALLTEAKQTIIELNRKLSEEKQIKRAYRTFLALKTRDSVLDWLESKGLELKPVNINDTSGIPKFRKKTETYIIPEKPTKKHNIESKRIKLTQTE